MKKPLLTLVAIIIVPLGAEGIGTTTYWSNSELKTYSQQLGPKVNTDHVAVERLGDFGSHYALVVHRKGNGPAESHGAETDFYVVQDGEGALLLGGEISDAKTVEPGEIRGSSIKGGKTIQLAPGDTVNIPPKTPHQVVLAPGQSITYLIVKIGKK